MSDKNEIITAYTLQQCNSCKEQSKQKFSEVIMFSKKFQNVPHVMDK